MMERYAAVFGKEEKVVAARTKVSDILEVLEWFKQEHPQFGPYKIGVWYYNNKNPIGTHQICDEETLRIILSTEEEQ